MDLIRVDWSWLELTGVDWSWIDLIRFSMNFHSLQRLLPLRATNICVKARMSLTTEYTCSPKYRPSLTSIPMTVAFRSQVTSLSLWGSTPHRLNPLSSMPSLVIGVTAKNYTCGERVTKTNISGWRGIMWQDGLNNAKTCQKRRRPAWPTARHKMTMQIPLGKHASREIPWRMGAQQYHSFGQIGCGFEFEAESTDLHRVTLGPAVEAYRTTSADLQAPPAGRTSTSRPF